MRGGQSTPGGRHQPHHVAPVDAVFAPLLLEVPSEGLPGEILHGHEDHAADRSHVEDGDHVRVGEARHRPCLAQQPGPGCNAVSGVAASGPQELDRDVPVELRVEGSVNNAHSSRAETVEDHVASEHAAPRQRQLVGRGPQGHPILRRIVRAASPTAQQDRCRLEGRGGARIDSFHLVTSRMTAICRVTRQTIYRCPTPWTPHPRGNPTRSYTFIMAAEATILLWVCGKARAKPGRFDR